ncbi:MAG: FecR domain-containing protein [Pirellulales bacterium]|nr:FecR domain-containing protein [Pirellulales bacterium]
MDREFEQFDQLCCDLVDGTIAEADFRRLQELMQSDVRLVDRYVEWIRLHSRLDLELGADGLAAAIKGARTAGKAAPKQLAPRALDVRGRGPASGGASRIRRTWPSLALATAALVLVAAMLALRENDKLAVAPTESVELPEPSVATPPAVLAEVPAGGAVDEDKRPAVRGRERAPRRVPRGFGVISQVMAAKWSDDRMATDVGARIPERRLRLVQGAVQIELVNGVSLIVQSPADFEVKSPQQVVCHSGQIRAHVPKVADEFAIVTPSYKVVDLGTEFALDVAADGSSKCHVLDGEVELHLPAREEREPVLLRQGESIMARPGGALEKDDASADRIPVDAATLADMASRYQGERFTAWKEFSEQFRQDPSLLAYFDFEGLVGWSRSLPCRSQGRMSVLDGAIVGCQVAQGRWPEKTALEFKRVNDRVRINVPGEHESLSMTAWIRIEGFERSLSSIMLTDGHDLGEVHWQITNYGALRLGVKAESDRSHDFDSPGVVTPDVLGRWLHLAVVYDGAAGRVTHFVNGEAISSHRIATRTVLRIGAGEIGNWVPIPVPQQDLWQSIRSLNGRIDDFAILSRPLSPEEVAGMYLVGRP